MSHRHPPPAQADPLTQALFAAARMAQQRAVRRRVRRMAKRHRTANQDTHAAPARRSPRQQLGDAGEDLALGLLQAAGCRLLARQLRCPAGELDLAMRDGTVLVFVEVRLRRDARFGTAADSIDAAKQRRLAQAARWWLRTLAREHFGGAIPPCRFDVVTIDATDIRWYRDALRPHPD